jgi:hypothetical protein
MPRITPQDLVVGLYHLGRVTTFFPVVRVVEELLDSGRFGLSDIGYACEQAK